MGCNVVFRARSVFLPIYLRSKLVIDGLRRGRSLLALHMHISPASIRHGPPHGGQTSHSIWGSLRWRIKWNAWKKFVPGRRVGLGRWWPCWQSSGIAGVGLAWYDASQLQAMNQTVNGQIKTDQQNAAQQFAALQQKQTQADAATAGLTSDLGVVTKRLRVTQSDLGKARKENAEQAQQIRDEETQKLADLNSNVNTQLATKASADDLNATNTNVTGVRTDLSGTQNDLKMARSELGTLIARNHDEVDQLRRLGERDYYEFTVSARNKPQKVGNMTVELRNVNPGKNQYTDCLADRGRSEAPRRRTAR